MVGLVPTGLPRPVYKLVLQLEHVFSKSLFMSNGELSGSPASHKIQASVDDVEEEQTWNKLLTYHQWWCTVFGVWVFFLKCVSRFYGGQFWQFVENFGNLLTILAIALAISW